MWDNKTMENGYLECGYCGRDTFHSRDERHGVWTCDECEERSQDWVRRHEQAMLAVEGHLKFVKDSSKRDAQ
jgi:ribosomal protein L37AE/L43A